MNSSELNAAGLPLFWRQLRHWSWHCGVNALPSFLIAGTVVGLFRQPMAVAGMLAAIGCFILAYATLTTLLPSLGTRQSIWGNALHMAKVLRLWISILSLLPLLIPLLNFLLGGPTDGGVMLVFLLPDFWCGMLAGNILDWLSLAGPGIGEGMNKFLTPFLLTLLEGLILSGLLLIFALLALLAGAASGSRTAHPTSHS